jgi:hypothetical protein
MIEITQYDTNKNIISKYGTNIVIKENLSSQVNGVNTTFVTSQPFTSNTLDVFLNGQLMVEGDDYTIVNNKTIQFVSAPLSGDKVIVKYMSA